RRRLHADGGVPRSPRQAARERVGGDVTRTERAVLKSLVPVICPPEAARLADAIVDHMTLTFGSTTPLLRRALTAGLYAYDLGALPRFGRRARSLSPAQAERYYRTWEHGITPMHVQF